MTPTQSLLAQAKGWCLGAMPQKYFIQTGHLSFALNPGVSASDAINSLFNPDHKVQIDCQLAIQIIVLKAIMHSSALGDAFFNKMFFDLKLIACKTSGACSYNNIMIQQPFVCGPQNHGPVAGDIVYFTNADGYSGLHPFELHSG